MNEADKELLTYAAEAAGIDVIWIDAWNGYFINVPHKSPSDWPKWNPITDDGDALRLAVKLKLTFHLSDKYARCVWVSFANGERCDEFHSMIDSDDPYAATRLAIVCAAAEIGKAMP